jgi:hypothetical protein
MISQPGILRASCSPDLAPSTSAIESLYDCSEHCFQDSLSGRTVLEDIIPTHKKEQPPRQWPSESQRSVIKERTIIKEGKNNMKMVTLR